MVSRVIRFGSIVAFLVVASASCRARDVMPVRLPPALPSVPSNQLRAVADFAVVSDKTERSRALFLEAPWHSTDSAVGG